ncbi:MAG: aminopeptidase P N-terminal domain-containing protein, partial [Muriicola sp.]|nr:aminopeptidase P N-terminal domain-containing protein [Muriicola sp.]
MKYDPIDASLFIANRKKFMKRMKPKSVAVFNSNDVYPISADSTMPFQQHRDIFYLSGVDQEESILLLFPDALKKENREILFVRETNDHIAVWEGEKLSKEQGTKVSGIKNVQWLSAFEKVFFEQMTEAETIYFNTNEHYRQAVETQTREDRFIISCKEKFPAHAVAKSNPILQEIRGVKEPQEIALMQKACDITEKGFRRILQFTRPGVWEYELEAEFLHEFIRNRSRG